MATRLGSLLGLVAVALTASGEASWASPADRPAVRVVVHDYANGSAAALADARKTLARIYGAIGVDIDWTIAGDELPRPARPDTFVVQMLIRPRAVAGLTSSATALARTLEGPHETGGTIFLFYDRIARRAQVRTADRPRVRLRDGARARPPRSAAACA